jgi:hypothetical protein
MLGGTLHTLRAAPEDAEEAGSIDYRSRDL